MFKFFLICFLLINVFAFSENDFDFENESTKIVKKFLNEMKTKEKLRCSGLGGGSQGEINLISIDWESYKTLNVSEARNLIVSLAETLLKEFNKNRVIRPYLHNYPFNVENIDLHIGFQKNYRQKDPNQVSYASLIKNSKLNKCIIFYLGFQEDSESRMDLHTKNYEEALRIYNSQFIRKI